MFEIDRQSATAFPRSAGGTRDRGIHAVAIKTQRSGTIMPVLLVLVLAVAAVALRPDTAQLCAKLDDFPCGP